MGRRHAALPRARTRSASASRSSTPPGSVVGFEEKPEQPKSDLIPIGVYFLRPDAFDVIERLAPSGRGEFEITDVLNHYIPRRRPVRPRSTRATGPTPARCRASLRAAELAEADDEAGHAARAGRAPERPGVSVDGPHRPGAHLLVTGGAGLHRLRASCASPRPRATATRVTVLDKLTYAGNRANLAAVEGDPEQARPLHASSRATSPTRTSSAALVATADAIVNVAAETHVDRSILDPEAFLRTGVIGVHVLLEAVRARRRAARGERAGAPLPPGQHRRGLRRHPGGPHRRDGPARARAARTPPRRPLGELLVRAYHDHLRPGRRASPAAPTPTARTSTPRSSSRCS